MCMAIQKQTYHHGDLRNALLQAAWTIIEKEGLDKLSLRGVARETGVSQAAPYAHFKDKNSLLVEVAASGFTKLKQLLEAPLNQCLESDKKRETLDKLGVIYVQFALDNRAVFRLMFSDVISDFPKSENYNIESAAAFSCLEKGIHQITEQPFATFSAWSTVHGLTSLIVDNRIEIHGDVETYVREVTKFLKFD